MKAPQQFIVACAVLLGLGIGTPASAGIVFTVAIDSAVLFDVNDHDLGGVYVPQVATLSTTFANPRNLGSFLEPAGDRKFYGGFDAAVETNSVYIAEFESRLSFPLPALSSSVSFEAFVRPNGSYSVFFMFGLYGYTSGSPPYSYSQYEAQYTAGYDGQDSALFDEAVLDGETLERLLDESSESFLGGYQEGYADFVDGPEPHGAVENWYVSDGHLVSAVVTSNVSEPATLALFGLGFIAVLARRRKRVD